jgi:hypothetical protein
MSLDSIVLNGLRSSKSPMTAAQVRDLTGLPLPLVTRTLQIRTQCTDQDVLRTAKGTNVLYQYVGPSMEMAL